MPLSEKETYSFRFSPHNSTERGASCRRLCRRECPTLAGSAVAQCGESASVQQSWPDPCAASSRRHTNDTRTDCRCHVPSLCHGVPVTLLDRPEGWV